MRLRQHFFVLEYLIDLDPGNAAIRAGYCSRGARRQGARLLRKPTIAAAIRKAMAERAERTGITAERVLREFARLDLFESFLAEGPDAIDLAEARILSADEIMAIIDYAAADPEDRDRFTEALLAKRRALETLAVFLGLDSVGLPSALPSA